MAQICSLSEGSRPYKQEINFLIVAIRLGNPTRLYVTDFTSNKLIESPWVKENFIRNYDERIPLDKILQLNCYKEKFEPFISSYKFARDEELLLSSSTFHVLPKAIFAAAHVKFKMFNGSLDGIVSSITLLDSKLKNCDPDLPLFKNTVSYLPRDYIASHFSSFSRTIPSSLLLYNSDGIPSVVRNMNNISSSPQRTPSHSMTRRSSFIESSLSSTPLIKLSSSSADLPTDHIHDSDYETSSQATFMRSKKRKKYPKIYTLNLIDEADDKVYEFSGVIVDFEPLLNQLCIKTSVDSPPKLNPITVLISDEISTRPSAEVPDEMNILKVSFESKTEIFKFLGMNEIELIYIKSSEVYSSFERILKSRKRFVFSVIRKLNRINDQGNYVLGWQARNLTLNGLLEAI